MTKREIILLLAICIVPFVVGGVVVASQESKAAKELPKTVGLTEIQRLKDENLQLKIARLRDQVQLLENERGESLRKAANAAGISDEDLAKYEYNQANFTFVLQPDKKDTAKAPVKK